RGGLSGKPLFEQSTRVLARLYELTQGAIPLVGVGGISNAETAWTKIEAGASLLQLYTALVFRGPALVSQILGGLEARLAMDGLRSLEDVRGSRAEAIARDGCAGP
ncbi:MAG: dihydroorotate dehydrogenase (quinone), partial [Hyphomicrobiales bacterium]